MSQDSIFIKQPKLLDGFLTPILATAPSAPAIGSNLVNIYFKSNDQLWYIDELGNDVQLTGGGGPGGGDVTGPSSSINNAIVVFNGATGKVIKDSTVLVSSLVPTSRQIIAGAGLTGGGALSSDVTVSLPITGVTAGSYTSANITVDAYGRVTAAANGGGGGTGDVVGPAAATDGAFALFDGTTGKLIKNGTLTPATFVQGPASAVNNNFALFDGTTGKLIKDIGVNASSFVSATLPQAAIPFGNSSNQYSYNTSDIAIYNNSLNRSLSIGGSSSSSIHSIHVLGKNPGYAPTIYLQATNPSPGFGGTPTLFLGQGSELTYLETRGLYFELPAASLFTIGTPGFATFRFIRGSGSDSGRTSFRTNQTSGFQIGQISGQADTVPSAAQLHVVDNTSTEAKPWARGLLMTSAYSGHDFDDGMLFHWDYRTGLQGFLMESRYSAPIYIGVDIPSGSGAYTRWNETGEFEVRARSLDTGDDNDTAILRINSTDNITWTEFRAITNQATSVTYTLPDGDGTVGQVLATDGTGGLSWISSSGTGDVVGPASATADAIVLFNGATGKLIKDSAVLVSSLVQTTRQVNAGTGLTGGGALSSDVTISLPNSGVTAASYTFLNATIDAQGRVTTASSGGAIAANQIAVGSGTNAFAGYSGFTWDNSTGTMAVTGDVHITTENSLVLFDNDNSNSVSVKSPAVVASNWTLTLPPNDGNSGDWLTTDGSGATTWTTPNTINTLGSAASELTVTGFSGNVFEIFFEGIANASSNDIFMTINADTTQTGYTLNLGYSNGAAMSFVVVANRANLTRSASANGEYFSGHGTVQRYYDGTNTIFKIHYNSMTNSGIAQSTILRTVSGDVPITTLSIRSNQTTGIRSGAYLVARKIY